MKKTLAILGSLLALSACNKREFEPTVFPEGKDIVVNLTIDRTDDLEDDPDARASVKTAFADGDVVFVFFSGVAAPKYLEMKYEGGNWTPTQKNGLTASDLSGASDKRMTGVYLPYASTATVASDGGKFVFSDVAYNGILYIAQRVTYSYGSELRGDLSLKAPALSGSDKYVHFDIAGYTRNHAFSLYQDYVKPISFTSVSANGTVSYQKGDKGKAVAGNIDKARDIVSFSGILDASANGKALDYQFSVNDETASVMYSRDAGTKTLRKSAAVGIGDISKASVWNALEYVYMGIDNANGEKLCWAKKNLGATAEQGEGSYGRYAAWGAADSYGLNGTFGNYTLTHAFENVSYDDSKDAVREGLGGVWRLPTKQECDALIANSDYAYSTHNTVNYGMTFTSRVTGYTDKSIFLPAAGYAVHANLQEAGWQAQYWTSSYETTGGVKMGRFLSFSQGSPSTPYTSYCYFGKTLRPVFSVASLDAGSAGSLFVPDEIHEYVDMGNGMKWATTNVGAKTPTDYGDYYAWGETETKSDYSQYTYNSDLNSKYMWAPGPTALGYPIRLLPEDDVARQKWGDEWRMPTYYECELLCNRNEYTWTWDYDRGGATVTSKETGNSIYLPAAGAIERTYVQNTGIMLACWASSAHNTSSSTSAHFTFSSMNSYPVVSHGLRYVGHSVRPVLAEPSLYFDINFANGTWKDSQGKLAFTNHGATVANTTVSHAGRSYTVPALKVSTGKYLRCQFNKLASSEDVKTLFARGFTLEAMFVDRVRGNSVHGVVCGTQSGGWGLALRENGTPYFIVGENQENFYWDIDATAPASTTELTHLTAVYDPYMRMMYLYVNGQLAASSNRISGYIYPGIGDTFNRFCLGADIKSGDSSPDFCSTDMLITDAKFYIGAFDSDQVRSAYEASVQELGH